MSCETLHTSHGCGPSILRDVPAGCSAPWQRATCTAASTAQNRICSASASSSHTCIVSKVASILIMGSALPALIARLRATFDQEALLQEHRAAIADRLAAWWTQPASQNQDLLGGRITWGTISCFIVVDDHDRRLGRDATRPALASRRAVHRVPVVGLKAALALSTASAHYCCTGLAGTGTDPNHQRAQLRSGCPRTAKCWRPRTSTRPGYGAGGVARATTVRSRKANSWFLMIKLLSFSVTGGTPKGAEHVDRSTVLASALWLSASAWPGPCPSSKRRSATSNRGRSSRP